RLQKRGPGRRMIKARPPTPAASPPPSVPGAPESWRELAKLRAAPLRPLRPASATAAPLLPVFQDEGAPAVHRRLWVESEMGGGGGGSDRASEADRAPLRLFDQAAQPGLLESDWTDEADRAATGAGAPALPGAATLIERVARRDFAGTRARMLR